MFFDRVYVLSPRTLNPDGSVTMAVADQFPDVPSGWTDKTAQLLTLPASVPFMLAMAEMPSATRTAINAVPGFIVLGFQTIETKRPGDIRDEIVIGGNLDTALTTAQLLAVRNWMNARWPVLTTRIAAQVKTGNSRRDLLAALQAELKD